MTTESLSSIKKSNVLLRLILLTTSLVITTLAITKLDSIATVPTVIRIEMKGETWICVLFFAYLWAFRTLGAVTVISKRFFLLYGDLIAHGVPQSYSALGGRSLQSFFLTKPAQVLYLGKEGSILDRCGHSCGLYVAIFQRKETSNS